MLTNPATKIYGANNESLRLGHDLRFQPAQTRDKHDDISSSVAHALAHALTWRDSA